MRGWIAALLCALLTLSTGCAYAAVTSRQEDAYALYFREADLDAAPGGDALREEFVTLEDPDDPAAAAWELMERLLAGPQDESLTGVVPGGTSLLSLELEGSRAHVDLSTAYRSLSGVELTLADYAITLTLTQIPQITSVHITVRGQELAYRDKQIFTARDVLRTSTEDVVDTMTVTLYFPDEDGVLHPEERMLDLYEGDTQVGAVAKAQQGEPETAGLVRALPEGFQILSVWLEERVCYVNLSSLQLEALPEDAGVDLGMDALSRALRDLPAVEEVRFLVDGEFTAG